MIDTIKDEELEIKKEDLLKNMKMLRNRVTDMFGPKSFFKGLVPAESHNGMITVNGEQFPIYISAHALSMGVHPEITNDIFDKENYLSLITDDDLMWYALVEHLTHQIDLLQVDNKRLSARVKSLVIEKTNRPDTAEKVSDPKTDIETNLDMGTLQLLTRITELENENESLKKKLFGGVPTKFGEQERGTPEDKIVKMDLESGLMMQQIAQLNTRIAQLEENLSSTETKLTTANNANDILRNQIASLKEEKKEAELLAYRLTRGDMHVQFDSMKSLEHENAVLKNKNADLNQKLYQKEDEDDLRKRIAEYAQKNEELLDYNKRLRQEITKLRVQLNSYSGVTVVDNEDMQQTITKETMAELTARINELESINENLQKENEDFTSIQEAHLETTTKFAEYKDRQKRLYKHFKNLAEMIEDLMELG